MANFSLFKLKRDGYVKRNFILNVMDGSLYTFGMNFVAINTIIPVLVKQMGGSNLSVGMIPVVWTIGLNFPQIFIANYTRKQRQKKKVVMTTALIQRVPWFILGLICFYVIDDVFTNLALLIFFAAYFLAAVGSGVNMPAWFDMLAKVTPTNLRGRLFAIRLTLGALLGIIAGYVAKQVLDTIAYPDNFSLLFVIAFSVMMISYGMLAMIKEERINTAAKEIHWKEFFKGLPGILKSNINYRNYLIADVLMITAGMANAFYTVYAFEKFELTTGYAGDFTIIMMIATIAGSMIFGYLADRSGHRINLFFAALFTVIASIAAVLASSIYVYFIVFIFTALTIALTQVSRITIIAELSEEEERSTYVALSNVITVPFTLSGIFAGWLANLYGYLPVFILSAVFAALSAYWFLFVVKEPRFHNKVNRVY